MDMKSLVGNVATVVTIASNLSGSLVCKNIVKNRSTGEMSLLPFIAGSLCSVLWLRYGLYENDFTIIVVNAVGLLLNFSYTLCFYHFALQKVVCQKQIFGAGAFLVFLTIYLVTLAKDIKEASNVTGVMASAGSMFFFASPLVSLAEVFRVKSVESLPFPIILSSFAVSTLWFYYGLLVKDRIIQVPNFIGALLSGFQLLLFAIFPSDQKQRKARAE